MKFTKKRAVADGQKKEIGKRLLQTFEIRIMQFKELLDLKKRLPVFLYHLEDESHLRNIYAKSTEKLPVSCQRLERILIKW